MDLNQFVKNKLQDETKVTSNKRMKTSLFNSKFGNNKENTDYKLDSGKMDSDDSSSNEIYNKKLSTSSKNSSITKDHHLDDIDSDDENENSNNFTLNYIDDNNEDDENVGDNNDDQDLDATTQSALLTDKQHMPNKSYYTDNSHNVTFPINGNISSHGAASGNSAMLSCDSGCSLSSITCRRPIRHSNMSISNVNNKTNNLSNVPNTFNKDRDPLATVSNNNTNVMLSSSNLDRTLALKKYMSIANSENFSLYKNTYNEISRIDYFSKLSDEIVLSIFKWLPKKALIRCCLVSHRFNSIGQDESLWTRLDLACKHIRAGAIGKILQRGLVILRLAQSKIADPIYELGDCPDGYICKLQYLDLSMIEITKPELHKLLSKCRYLKKLSLEHVPLDDLICKEIAANRKLEALNLAMCQGITTESIKILATHLTLLHSLNISWTSLSFDSIKIFVENVPTDLLRLNISGCRQFMTDKLLSNLVSRCPKLKELDLSDCSVLTSEAINIVFKLKYLEYLSVSRCYNIPVAAYLKINKSSSLEFLDVFGVLSEQSLKSLQDAFPSIGINKFIHSSVARPTVGSRRTSIWGLRTRD